MMTIAAVAVPTFSEEKSETAAIVAAMDRLQSRTISPREHECVPHFISCGQTLFSDLSIFDCNVGSGIYLDVWFFTGTAGQRVTVNLASSSFDPFLTLHEPVDQEIVASNDNSGPGDDARISNFRLNRTSTRWGLGVANFNDPFDVGNYSLSLACQSPAPEPEPIPIAPSNLTATAISASEIKLRWRDNSTNEDAFIVEGKITTGGTFQEIGSVGANETVALLQEFIAGTPYTSRVRARNASGDSAYSNEATATTFGGATGPCVANQTTLCLNNDRFKVEVDWRTLRGDEGPGMAVELTPDTGYFWFFNPENVEMVLKVLDGCDFNNRYWVFAGGLTNVEVQITVTDTETGAVRENVNPLGTPFQPIQDTEAFATCP